MGRLSANARKRRAKLRLFKEQDGKCHWCKEPMLHPSEHEPNTKKPTPPRLCTLEHLDHRYDRAPGKHGKWVAACWECNTKRGAERVKAEPIERLWQESGALPMGLRRAMR